MTSNFARFNDDQIKFIVNQPWHKEDFAKKIWKNYRDVSPNQLGDVILRGDVYGLYSPQRITKMFQQRFEGIRCNEIHRLVITEMGHVAEQIQSIYNIYKEEYNVSKVTPSKLPLDIR